MSFDDIPRLMQQMIARMDAIEKKIDELPSMNGGKDEWWDVDELCDYLPWHPAKATVYQWTSSHFIPHHKKGKNVIFRKSEIEDWLNKDRLKSQAELIREAQDFVNNKKKNRF